ncbi:50S ribosomal protein L31e [Candidatus Pacearchaeota archaeon]|nr:50S ribosomal protein L31e [Candidatus Pacearchaeota archaeon]
MADKTETLTREYTIPLRKEWRKVANYRRAGRAAKAIKKFIAKHMKVPERDVSKVKLDMYLNNEIWFRGRRKPPAKIKIKAIKEGDIVKVMLAETPKQIKFAKQKHDKFHKESEKIKEAPEKEKEEKTEVEKKNEKEKEQASAIQKEQIAEQKAAVQKHVPKENKTPIRRLALKK